FSSFILLPIYQRTNQCCTISFWQTVSRPTFQQFMTYSSGISGDSNANGGTSATRVTADTDTHQDFQPTSKGSDMSLQDIVAQDIKENPVIIFMKGYPEAPRCGFSALAVKASLSLPEIF
uniref:Glutaredoxin domain-containing protein n=1 Tax=Aegilops tauschii subsp. strangulata TaxID=200361 RepID=A0A453EB20_AEGTS